MIINPESLQRQASERLMASSAYHTCSPARLVTTPWSNITALKPRALMSKINTGTPQWPGCSVQGNFVTTTSDCSNYSTQGWLLHGGNLQSLLSQLASLSLIMIAHLKLYISLCTADLPYWKAHLIWSALSMSPFRGGNKCTFGNFVAHGGCIIDSWSEIVQKFFQFKQLLVFRKTPPPFYIEVIWLFYLFCHCTNETTCKWCSSVEFVFSVYKKQIVMPSLNDIYILYTCAWPQHEQMLIDSFLSVKKKTLLYDTPIEALGFSASWVETLSCLLQSGLWELGNNWMQNSV